MNKSWIRGYSKLATGVKAVTALVLLGTALTLSACNTTAGAGQDVTAAGKAVTNTAEKAKQGI